MQQNTSNILPVQVNSFTFPPMPRPKKRRIRRKSNYTILRPEEKKKVLEEDGLWGKETTKYTQKFLGTVVDCIVSNQLNNCKKYMPNMLAVSWEFENIARGGSVMIKALQKLVGAKIDGYAGKDTIKCLQKYLKKRGYYTGAIDGIAGYGTVIGWQKYINLKFA